MIKKGHFYFFGRCKINKTYYLSDSYYFFKSRLTIGIMIYGFPYFLTKYINIHIYKRYLEPKRYKAPMPPRGFKCKKCESIFPSRSKLERHLNRKTPCDPMIDPNPEDTHHCIFCGRSYASTVTLNRHYSVCKVKNDPNKANIIVDHILKKMEDQDETIEDLKKKLEEGKTISANSSNTNIAKSRDGNNRIHSDDIDNSINININNYGGQQLLEFDAAEMAAYVQDIMTSTKGKKKKLADNIKSGLLCYLTQNKPEKMFEFILNAIHNNDQLPEAQNIFQILHIAY